MVVPPLSNRLSAADIDFLASYKIPTLTHGPGTHLRSNREQSPSRVESRPSRFSRRTAKDKALERAPVVSRKLRRYVNDKALYLTAADIGALPTTRADLRSLFEHRAHTIFTTLNEDKDAALAWAPYIDINLDQSDKEMIARGTPDTIGQHNGHNAKDNDGNNGLNRIDRKIRNLLKSKAAAVKPIIQQVEDTVMGLEQGESIVLRPPHALGRLVAHGVAQFHSLAHSSSGKGADRVMVIRRQAHVVPSSARLIDAIA